jgi:D-alanine transaminase
MQVYLNGSFVDLEDAKVSVNDRGFIFGDGIYEVIRCIKGRTFRVKEHMQRLDEGLEGLDITLESEERDKLLDIGKELLQKNNLTDGEAKIYIQITRGAAWPRTHPFPRPEVSPTVYIATIRFEPAVDLHENGIAVKTMSDIRWSRCDLKTVNLLPNTLAREEAKTEGYDSAILVRDGVVTESPNANIFGVDDGILRTFPECNYILSGITRDVILEIADELEIPVEFNPIKEGELFELDELFFCGTTTDIQPVVEVDGRSIGTGEPGPVVRKIQEKFFSEKLYANPK